MTTGQPTLTVGGARKPATPSTLVLHDYLTQQGGAERVALVMAQDLGGGAITTSAYRPESTFPEFADVDVTEILPVASARTPPRRVTLAPLAAASFARHRQRSDVVLCSSSGWSHWTSTPSPTVVYCHTPPRWFWAADDYFQAGSPRLRSGVSTVLGAGRALDRRRARRAHTYVANSTTVRERIRHAYGVDAQVIHPPLSLTADGPMEPVEGIEPGFVLTVARDRGYKNVNVARRVFGAGGLGQLVVVGGGAPRASDRGRIVATGRVTDSQLRWLYHSSRAVLALSQEDFGLTPVEGHAFGRPTVALRAGGYLDTCTEGINAVFTNDLTDAAVRAAVSELDQAGLAEDAVRASAEQYCRASFAAALGDVLREAVEQGS